MRLAVGLLLVPALALAEGSLLGRWVLDEAAVEARLEAAIRAQWPQIRADQEAAMAVLVQQMAADQAQALRGSTLVVEADGRVIIDPADGPPQVGRWRREGPGLRLVPDDPAGVELIARPDGDRVEVLPADVRGPAVFVFQRAPGSPDAAR